MFNAQFKFSPDLRGDVWLGRGTEVAGYGLKLSRDLRECVDDGLCGGRRDD